MRMKERSERWRERRAKRNVGKEERESERRERERERKGQDGQRETRRMGRVDKRVICCGTVLLWYLFYLFSRGFIILGNMIIIIFPIMINIILFPLPYNHLDTPQSMPIRQMVSSGLGTELLECLLVGSDSFDDLIFPHDIRKVRGLFGWPSFCMIRLPDATFPKWVDRDPTWVREGQPTSPPREEKRISLGSSQVSQWIRREVGSVKFHPFSVSCLSSYYYSPQ